VGVSVPTGLGVKVGWVGSAIQGVEVAEGVSEAVATLPKASKGGANSILGEHGVAVFAPCAVLVVKGRLRLKKTARKVLPTTKRATIPAR
jgi:hypothetical protein